MGIFDIFKKRKTESTFPENELEKSLLQAASNASAQKDFYQKLLWNQLYVLTRGDSDFEKGVQTLEENTSVAFVALENGQIPIFTSTNRIFDKRIIKDEVPYLSFKGQDLFCFATDASFILNPFSDYGKELLPEEIENLLNGTIYDKIDEYEVENAKKEKFNALFNSGAKNQEGLIHLDGYHKKRLSTVERAILEESVLNFQKCLELMPEHWQSMTLMAKAYQRLENHTQAFQQLEMAFKIELENHTIPMEASLEAMHLGMVDKALYYSEEALKRKPNDYALMGNHAMNLLLAQEDNKAEETIKKAIQLHPVDSVNRNIESIIKDVLTGLRERPTFEDTIK